MNEKDYDVIIFGATGFVGQIMCKYMVETFSDSKCPDKKVRWAIAGRSETKLNQVQKDLGLNQEQLPIFIVDAKDEEQLKTLCEKTRVIVSTVGPYALYGEALVKACVEVGTDYCDITGEAHWVVQMISHYQQQALESGARIVNCCGFDSIPSDLGVYFTQTQAKSQHGKLCDEINMRVTQLKGTFSGGTYATILNAVKEISGIPALRKVMASPYCLCPSDHPFTTRQKRCDSAEHDPHTDSWMAPFIMEDINTRIVHRTNSLLDYMYDDEFKYDEALLTGKGPNGRKRASRTAMGLKALMIAAAIPPTRWVLSKFILPKPGEGPNQEQQDKGRYQLLFVGHVPHRGQIRCTVSGDKDPGYGSTAKILAQAAVCLALDIPKDEVNGGFWTPASIFKEKLIDRLQKYAGVSFKVEKP